MERPTSLPKSVGRHCAILSNTTEATTTMVPGMGLHAILIDFVRRARNINDRLPGNIKRMCEYCSRVYANFRSTRTAGRKYSSAMLISDTNKTHRAPNRLYSDRKCMLEKITCRVQFPRREPLKDVSVPSRRLACHPRSSRTRAPHAQLRHLRCAIRHHSVRAAFCCVPATSDRPLKEESPKCLFRPETLANSSAAPCRWT